MVESLSKNVCKKKTSLDQRPNTSGHKFTTLSKTNCSEWNMMRLAYSSVLITYSSTKMSLCAWKALMIRQCLLSLSRKLQRVLSFAVYVSENSTVDTYFAYVSTNDEDVGRNGQVNVRLKSITPSGSAANPLKTFILSDGLLGVAGTLDREIVNHYTVVLKACDQGETQQ